MAECEHCGEPRPRRPTDLGDAPGRGRWERWARQHREECEGFRKEEQAGALLCVGLAGGFIAFVGGALAVGAIAGTLAVAASPFVAAYKVLTYDQEERT